MMRTLDILFQRLRETQAHRDARRAWMVAAQKEMTQTLEELAEDDAEVADLSRAIDRLTELGFDMTVLA